MQLKCSKCGKLKDVRMIVYMWRTKEFTQKEIAKIYKVGQDNVSLIVNKKTWKHIWKGITNECPGT